MAWPSHALVAFGGSLPGPEVWTCTIRGEGTSGGFLPTPDTYLSEMHSALSTWWSTLANMTNNNATLDWVKANNIDPDGHYVDSVTHVYDYPAPVNGAATPNMPPICCSRFSWVTAASRGVAHGGGVYVPVAATTTLNTSLFTSTDQAKYVLSAKALLTAVANAGSSTSHGLILSVISPGTPKNGHVGVARPITGVRVGSVVDVQRRRKAQIPETYMAAAWP